MILQTFNNPIWTISEVGSIYLLIFLIAGFLICNLFDSIVEMGSDLKNGFDEKENKSKSGSRTRN